MPHPPGPHCASMRKIRHRLSGKAEQAGCLIGLSHLLQLDREGAIKVPAINRGRSVITSPPPSSVRREDQENQGCAGKYQYPVGGHSEWRQQDFGGH